MDEMIVLLLGAAPLFGDTVIPKLARSLGSAKNEFEKGLNISQPAELARHAGDSQ
jgi:Sec-independent protein translocase protein TatA